MRVVIFAPYTNVGASFGTDLELTQEHLNRGDDLTFVTYEPELRISDRNPYGSRLVSLEKESIQQKGLSALTNIEKLRVLNLRDFAGELNKNWFEQQLINLTNISDLKKFAIKDFQIGYAVAASLITRTGDSHPHIASHRKFIRGLMLSSMEVFTAFCQFFASKQFDKLYVFNGRYSVTAAAISAAVRSNLRYSTHDRGRTHEYYEVFDEASAADMVWFKNHVNYRWLRDNISEQTSVVDDWYKRKRAGLPLEWISFTASQSEGLLPKTWSQDIKNYVVFTTSENESAALGPEWENSLFESQASGVEFLAEQLSIVDEELGRKSKLYVRIHPNQAAADRKEIKRFTDLKKSNVEIIMPSSKISTYAMMDACDTVITFGSTMGIESTFWGKPSLLLAPTFYGDVGATYNPRTLEEVKSLLKCQLQPKPKDGAYKYAYLHATLGRPFKHYKPTDQLAGTFNGVSLEASGLLNKLLRFVRFVAACLRQIKRALRS